MHQLQEDVKKAERRRQQAKVLKKSTEDAYEQDIDRACEQWQLHKAN